MRHRAVRKVAKVFHTRDNAVVITHHFTTCTCGLTLATHQDLGGLAMSDDAFDVADEIYASRRHFRLQTAAIRAMPLAATERICLEPGLVRWQASDLRAALAQAVPERAPATSAPVATVTVTEDGPLSSDEIAEIAQLFPPELSGGRPLW